MVVTTSPSLEHLLFAEAGEAGVFAVFDGASIPDLLRNLYTHEPEYLCLYRGALDPDLAECAPYLVRLEQGTAFTDWVFAEAMGNHWGIFCTAPADMRALRTHFRKFLIVYDPQGRPLYFRFYDPRVLRVFLPTCNAQEQRDLFGPVTHYITDAQEPDSVLRFGSAGGALTAERIVLLQAGAQEMAAAS